MRSLKDPFKVKPQYDFDLKTDANSLLLVSIGTAKERREIPTEYNLLDIPSNSTTLALASEQFYHP